MAERNLKSSPLYELTITGRQTGGQTEKATYRGTNLRFAQKWGVCLNMLEID